LDRLGFYLLGYLDFTLVVLVIV